MRTAVEFTRTRNSSAGRLPTVLVLATAALLAVSGSASADPHQGDAIRSAAPAAAPAPVDVADPDLRLAPGATLAPPRVLDITSVVEDVAGDQRREESRTDVRIALQAEVLFAKDSAVLSESAKARIAEVAEEIKKANPPKVTVSGFTDNLGSAAHGDALSLQRAEAVHALLAQQLGPTVSFDVKGLGERSPIADNGTEEGRRKNRRVEVSFTHG
ncbi:OmpA family protein [Yinghuangia aomiensis]